MKRMLERKGSVYYINASSIDLLMTCPRKAYYALERGLRGESESDALVFGKAIHAGLEEFYKTNPEDRKLDAIISKFVEAGGVSLLGIPESDKRSAENGKKILGRYFETYKNDPWVVYQDSSGPYVERSFEVPFVTHNGFTSIYLHGQVDCLLKNTETGEIVICDHKTTSAVSDLVNRVKPNLQFSLYAWAINHLGIKVNRVMVNGIQIAKTKSDFLRIFTERGNSDYSELASTVSYAVESHRRFLDEERWPMNTSGCANYGGCQYLDVCQLNKEFRETAIQQIYQALPK